MVPGLVILKQENGEVRLELRSTVSLKKSPSSAASTNKAVSKQSSHVTHVSKTRSELIIEELNN